MHRVRPARSWSSRAPRRRRSPSPEFGVSSGSGPPTLSTNCPCLHVSIFRTSASFTAALGCCMKLATQDGVSATITAALVRSDAIRSAVPPRTHPIHEKPMIIMPTAPTITPQTAGLSHGTCNWMRHLLVLGEGYSSLSSACGGRDRSTCPLHTQGPEGTCCDERSGQSRTRILGADLNRAQRVATLTLGATNAVHRVERHTIGPVRDRHVSTTGRADCVPKRRHGTAA